jgi:integrase
MPTISERTVADLPRPLSGNKLHYFSGATLQGKKAPSGFAVRVTSAGTKSFVWFHRVGGKPHLETIGRWDENEGGGSLTVLKAIIAAKARADAIHNSEVDPRPERTRRLEDGNKPDGETIGAMLDEFVKRHVEKGGLRSADIIKRTFDRLVKPAIGQHAVPELRRSHVVKMLDDVADNHGPVMADRTLALIRKAFNWRAARDDDFHPPIAKGMARTKPKERARARILSDADIRDLWTALDAIKDAPACYPAFVRTLLMTATRRNEAAEMRWDEIEGDTWTIPAARYKTKTDHAVPLTGGAKGLIGQRPKDYAKRPFVFSTTGGAKPFSGYSKAKAALDKKIAELRTKAGRDKIEPWTLHDLRRTARSLMSRAGVPTDHAERSLGHVIAGVRSVYDRHEYLAEKKKAFDALAALLAQILNPAPNVMPMKRA